MLRTAKADLPKRRRDRGSQCIDNCLRGYSYSFIPTNDPVEPATVVPTRGPLSGREAHILERLKRLSPSLADSLEQAFTDLNDPSRLSYMGPAGEVREVMRATVQMLAPDIEVRKQSWFTGIEQGNKRNPSQAERTRYAVQKRGGDREQVKGHDELIDQLVAQISRQTHATGSSALHSGAVRERGGKLTGWIFAILDEVLPE